MNRNNSSRKDSIPMAHRSVGHFWSQHGMRLKKRFLGAQSRQGSYQPGNHQKMPNCIPQAEEEQAWQGQSIQVTWDFFLSPHADCFKAAHKDLLYFQVILFLLSMKLFK